MLSHLRLPGAGKHSRQEGCRASPEPAGRSQRAKAACSEQQYPQEGEQTTFSPSFAISRLLPDWVPITATLSSGPSPHVIHFSRAFPGFGPPSEVLQAGMNILAIPRWPQTPTQCHPGFPFLPFAGCSSQTEWFCVSPPHKGQETGLSSEAIIFADTPG